MSFSRKASVGRKLPFTEAEYIKFKLREHRDKKTRNLNSKNILAPKKAKVNDFPIFTLRFNNS